MRAWSPLCILALLAAASAASATTDAEFFLFRDEQTSRYVIMPEADAPYSVGLWGEAASPVYTGNGRAWDFVFTGLPAPVQLDAQRDLRIELVAGGTAWEVGTAEIEWELVVAGEVVALGGSQRIVYLENRQGTTWSVPAPDVSIQEGDMFRVLTALHVGRGVRLDLEPSRLVVPVLATVADAPAPAPVPDTPAAPAIRYDQAAGMHLGAAFENASGVHVWNWTVDMPQGTAELAWSADAGEAMMRIADSANQTVLDAAPQQGSQSVSFSSDVGVWSVRLEMENFTGSFRIDLTPPAAAPEAAAPLAQASDEGKQDLTPSAAPLANDAPLPVWAVLAALVAAWTARRR
jgi:hypothetical protein